MHLKRSSILIVGMLSLNLFAEKNVNPSRNLRGDSDIYDPIDFNMWPMAITVAGVFGTLLSCSCYCLSSHNQCWLVDNDCAPFFKKTTGAAYAIFAVGIILYAIEGISIMAESGDG